VDGPRGGRKYTKEEKKKKKKEKGKALVVETDSLVRILLKLIHIQGRKLGQTKY